MKKEKIVVTALVGVLAVVVILAIGNADLVYIGATGLFFALCMAYADWCERL